MRRRWGDSAPPAFSVVWTGYITVGRRGLYQFATTSDDGSRLFVDGQMVVDNGGFHSARTQSGRVYLARGPHVVRLEYVQLAGNFELEWSWAHDDESYRRVPAWALSQSASQYLTVLIARVVDLAGWSFAMVATLAAAWYLSARWRAVANVMMVGVVLATAMPFAPIVSTNFYEYLVHLSFVRRLQWGSDIVSTYGPWGFVGVPLYHPATFASMLLLNGLILAATAFRVFVFIRRTHPAGIALPGLWVALIFVPLTILPVAEWSAALYCFHIIATTIGVEWILRTPTAFAPVDATTAGVLGFLALVKISVWPLAAILMVASCFQSRRYGAALTTCLMLGGLVGWFAAGQSLAHVWAFGRLGLDVIAGYKDGMSLWGSSDAAAVLFVAAAFVPMAVLVYRFRPRATAQWIALSVPAIVCGQLFQAAFVRSGTHHIISNSLGLCTIVLLLIVALVSDRTRRWSSAAAIVMIAIIVVLLFRAAPRSPYYGRPQMEARGLIALSANGFSWLEVTRERALSRLRVTFPLAGSETTGTGATLAGDIGVLEANNVRFTIEPTMTSYAAYTRRLEELNARWLERGGMDWILWCGPPAVDLRYPTEVDAKAVVYAATHFQYRDHMGSCALLRRHAGPEWHVEHTDVRRVGFDQPVPVDAADGSIVWAEISVRETLLGKLIGALFKPAPVQLYADQKNGTTFVQNIVPSMTRQGFLLSPVVNSWDPLAAIAAGRGSGQQVVAVRVGSRPLGFSRELFYRPEVTVMTTILRSPLASSRTER